MAAKRKRKPGVSIPDAERHTLKRTLRLTPAESAALDAVAEARGVNVSRTVGALALRAAQPHPWAEERAMVATIEARAAAIRRAADEYFASTSPPSTNVRRTT